MNSLLEPITALFNRGIKDSSSARGLCKALEGRSLSIVLQPPETRMRLVVQSGALVVAKHDDAEQADVELRGGALGIARLLVSDPEDILRSGAVHMDGDPEIAEQFRALFTMARPDPEEELAKILGDVPAHQLGNAARGLRDWGKQAKRSLGRSLSEYLREERRDLPTRTEVQEYLDAVDNFSTAVERAEARIQHLYRQMKS